MTLNMNLLTHLLWCPLFPLLDDIVYGRPLALARRFILSRFRRDEEDRKYSSSFVKEDPDDAERWPSTTGSKSF